MAEFLCYVAYFNETRVALFLLKFLSVVISYLGRIIDLFRVQAC